MNLAANSLEDLALGLVGEVLADLDMDPQRRDPAAKLKWAK